MCTDWGWHLLQAALVAPWCGGPVWLMAHGDPPLLRLATGAMLRQGANKHGLAV